MIVHLHIKQFFGICFIVVGVMWRWFCGVAIEDKNRNIYIHGLLGS